MEIQDFGKKIGGAKKDLWKERGLSIEDLLDMNDAEKIKFIKKDNVWKKPNYQELVDNGVPIRVVYFIKMIRDALPTKPVLTYFDRGAESIQEKQEGYIEFISNIRDFTMNLSTEDDVLNFYNNFMTRYVSHRESSYYVDVSPDAHDCIDNKLLAASRVRNFNQIDRDISKKQFLYTDDEKVLSQFSIFLFDNKNVKFEKDYSGRDIISVKERFGTRYLYPQENFSNPINWKENTIFICQNGRIIKNNIESIDAAEKYILDNYKEQNKDKTGNRKKAFKPKQLEHIIRDGEDYRNNKNITGEDMMKKFNFKGGEFGNWLNERDRQESLNYGYDALLDLSKALNILPTDISLGNRLSIAFGSRGSGNALAHYEPDREVINLTKMKGAGSLAHEWAHALDDIIGKKEGYRGFLTESSSSKVVFELKDAMKYKTICNEETLQNQIKRCEEKINRLKKHIDSFFPSEYLNEETTKLKDKLIQNIIDSSESTSKNFIEYLKGRMINNDVVELSNLRKLTVGRNIPKEERERIFYMQNDIFNAKDKVGKPEKVKTDFYKNSIIFDDLYSKTSHGYWQSTIEMFARSFACYVKDKLNNRSDYLCGHAESDIGIGLNKENDLDIIKAFPEGEERTIINEKIDRLIEIIKEKALLHDCRTQEILNEVEYDY